jgi:hypothetical protein
LTPPKAQVLRDPDEIVMRGRLQALPLMAAAQICLGGNAVALHYRVHGVVTLILPLAALTLVSVALAVWARAMASSATDSDVDEQ